MSDCLSEAKSLKLHAILRISSHLIAETKFSVSSETYISETLISPKPARYAEVFQCYRPF